MKKKILIPFVIIVLLIQSCVPCLHPLYTKGTIRLDKELEGKWSSKSSKEEESWTFKKGKGDYYDASYTADGITNQFEVHLLQLGENYYMDFFPSGTVEGIGSMLATHLVAAHTFAKVQISDNRLEIHPFNPDWISEQIKNRYIRIKHEIVSNDNVVITASTKDLQKFVLKYADTQIGKEKVFMDSNDWIKEK